jgi:hypothetical protein
MSMNRPGTCGSSAQGWFVCGVDVAIDQYNSPFVCAETRGTIVFVSTFKNGRALSASGIGFWCRLYSTAWLVEEGKSTIQPRIAESPPP